jgi:hypothetical protein
MEPGYIIALVIAGPIVIGVIAVLLLAVHEHNRQAREKQKQQYLPPQALHNPPDVR